MLQIDVWSGDLHQDHVGTFHTEDWKEASAFMETQVEAGMLCNVLHTDFKAPPEKIAAQNAALVASLSN